MYVHNKRIANVRARTHVCVYAKILMNRLSLAAPSANGARPWADLPTEMVDGVAGDLDIFSTVRLTGRRLRVVGQGRRREHLPALWHAVRVCSCHARTTTTEKTAVVKLATATKSAPSTCSPSPEPRIAWYPAFISAVRNRWWVGAKGNGSPPSTIVVGPAFGENSLIVFYLKQMSLFYCTTAYSLSFFSILPIKYI